MKSILSVSMLLLIFQVILVNHTLSQSQTPLTEAQVLALAEENIENYRKSDAQIKVVDARGEPLKDVSLKIVQETQDFLFGALAFDLVWEEEMDAGRRALFKERFSELFNLALLPFYWGAYEPEAGHPRWERIDPIVEWCLENGITPKGHPLAWTHEIGLPDYVLEMTLEESENLLHSRIIENVVGYRDRITLWDVVNEPINTVSWEMAHRDKSKRYRYRTDLPLEELAGWVEDAYKTAHRANPDNAYILNEFKQIADPVIRQRFYDFTALLLERGTPIAGLGLQAHEPRADWYDPVDVWESLELYKTFGLPLHITEFSPQSGGAEITGGYRTGTWTPETQAEFAESMYRICFGHPSVVSINWWAFSDANAWLPGAGFVDSTFAPKPVFHTLKKLIKEEWMTPETELVTDQHGKALFRGFHGKYRVIVTTPDGESFHHTVHVTASGDNRFTLKTE